MQTRTVEWEGEGMSARIVVGVATVRMGIQRTIMQRGARQFVDEAPGVRLLRQFTWPDLMAATMSGEVGKKAVAMLTFEEWLELPEALVISWEKAVYELNPHWLPSAEGKASSDNARSEMTSVVASSGGIVSG